MSMHKHRLGSGRFGVTTFFAYTHPSDQVGPDGLPVTPSAVRILGRFSLLKELNHKNLTAYIDIARLKNGMINLCSSLYKCGAFSRPPSSYRILQDQCRGLFQRWDSFEVNVVFTYLNCEVFLYCSAVDRRRMTFEIVDALAYLNRQGLVHRNLSPTNILVSPEVLQSGS